MYPLLKPIANNAIFAVLQKRRGVRVVEGARLESVYMGNCIAGSNPALSAFARRSFAAYAKATAAAKRRRASYFNFIYRGLRLAKSAKGIRL